MHEAGFSAGCASARAFTLEDIRGAAEEQDAGEEAAM